MDLCHNSAFTISLSHISETIKDLFFHFCIDISQSTVIMYEMLYLLAHLRAVFWHECHTVMDFLFTYAYVSCHESTQIL